MKKRIWFETNQSNAANIVYDWIKSFLMVWAILVVCFTLLFRVVKVEGPSMQQTLQQNDLIAVTNLFYSPHDGDVVVIAPTEKFDKAIVKRIIATEGETLKLDYDNEKVIVDGIELNEPYLFDNITLGKQLANYEIPSVIPEGMVFVMGDHRDVSLDSRKSEIGLIDRGSIIGRASIVLFPFNHLTIL